MERRPVGKDLVDFTTAAQKAQSNRDPTFQFLRNQAGKSSIIEMVDV